MRTPIRRALVASVLILTCPLAATAQEATAAVRTETAVDELVADGVALRKEGRDAEALLVFERAYAVQPSARAVAQMGLALQALGRWRDAEIKLVQALLDSTDNWVSRQRVRLQESLASVQSHLAWLQIESNRAESEVSIEGEPYGRLPESNELRVTAGKVTVELRAAGFAPIRQTLVVEPGMHALAAFAFVENPPGRLPLENVASADSGAAAVRSTSLTRTAGWAALAGAGVLFLFGVGGQLTREWEARLYNDDNQCAPSAGLSRYDRCGGHRDLGYAAQTVAVVGFAGAGIAAVSGMLLFATSRATPAPKVGWAGCALSGIGLECGGAF